MDFFDVEQVKKKDGVYVFPNFQFKASKDIMTKGKSFYAVWDEERKTWSTDEYDLIRIIDDAVREKVNELEHTMGYETIKGLYMMSQNSGIMHKYRDFIQNAPDSYIPLDSEITFFSDKVDFSNHASKRLNYDLSNGDCPYYERLISTLYSPDEREKFEWAIGSIFVGDSKFIQKFIVFYGEGGTGKSTVLNIIEKLFQGYVTYFDAKAITSANNQFSTEAFKNNPLVAINHDGDLSAVEDNTKFNSIVSHEYIMMNEKYKASYSTRVNAMLFIGTNQPVKITDSKSGLLRRLINVTPTGDKLPYKEYRQCMDNIDFELGAIAQRCIDIYKLLGPNYYENYRPLEMMYKTDIFFNFVEANYSLLSREEGICLKQAWAAYKEYCDEANIPKPLPMYKFREELKDYYDEYKERYWDGSQGYTNYYIGFKKEKFVYTKSKKLLPKDEEIDVSNAFPDVKSIFDDIAADYPAQYATPNGTPSVKWEINKTTLKDLNTNELHYVKVPENHIVIDFDLKDENGDKSYKLNLEAAQKWPVTYGELSKSGKGIHLHYIYDGDVTKLSRVYDTDIEVKVFTGNSSLRRQLTFCNNNPIATISSGLPLREEKQVISDINVQDEKHLRNLIAKALRKEIEPRKTTPCVNFIAMVLDQTYNSGMHYDVSDMRMSILNFASRSTHQAHACVNKVSKMKFKSDEPNDDIPFSDEAPITFFDIEIFPNLFIIVYKFQGEENKCNRMINPSPAEVGRLFKCRLIGFNNRRYDNHILYARYIGYDIPDLYVLSQRLINGGKKNDNMFGEAYNISYTDIYDFSSKKQSLKKWEIEMGIHHLELGLPWDKPVPEELWTKVAEYCDNDVIATEKLFEYLKTDWTAREILADISGLTVNHTTNQHAIKIIFGNDKHPGLIYTDLKTGKQYGPGEGAPAYIEEWITNNKKG